MRDSDPVLHDMLARVAQSAPFADVVSALERFDGQRPDTAHVLTYHRVDEPVLGEVEGEPLIEGRVGRRGRNVALEVSDWRSA